MKTKLTLLALLISTLIVAQNGINYKALIKDNSGASLTSSPVSVQFIIYEGQGLTNNVYQESHATNTDANGFVIVTIGEGTTSDVFTDIIWGEDAHFLNVQVNTGSGLIDMGTSQFMAVPYALSSADNRWLKNINGIYTWNNAVGLNTDIPLHTLDVRVPTMDAAAQLNVSNQDRSRYLRFFSGSSLFPDPSITMAPGNNLLFASFDDNTSSFNEYMRIAPTGNVGIGVTNPQAKLEVDGKIKIGDDNSADVEGAIRYDSTSKDFEGYDGVSYKSFNNTTYLFDKGAQTTHTLRNDFIVSDVNVPVIESGTYFITFRCEIFGLIGNVSSAPSDLNIEVYLAEDNNGTISYLDIDTRKALSDQTAGGIIYRWRREERFSNFMIRSLSQGSSLEIHIKVRDNGIGNLSADYNISNPEIFAFKL